MYMVAVEVNSGKTGEETQIKVRMVREVFRWNKQVLIVSLQSYVSKDMNWTEFSS